MFNKEIRFLNNVDIVLFYVHVQNYIRKSIST